MNSAGQQVAPEHAAGEGQGRDRAALPAASTWPYDTGQPPGPGTRLETLSFTLPDAVVSARQDLGDQHAAPAAAFFSACLQLLLFRVGSPWANVDVSDISVGMLISVPAAGPTSPPEACWMASQLRIDPAEPFAGLLRRAVVGLRRDLARGWPGPPRRAAVMPPDGSGTETAWRAAVVIEGPDIGQYAGDIRPGVFPGNRAELADVDFALVIGEFRGALSYAADRYRPETARRIVQSYLRILQGTAENPQAPVGDLPVAELPAAREAAAPGDEPGQRLPSAHELFDRAAAEHPEAVALRWAGGEMTYADLRVAADRLVPRLGGPRLVALCARRSAELAIALLAILKCGAGYVPLDPAYPRERLDYMLADSGAELLICDAELAAVLARPDRVRLRTIQDLFGGPDGAGAPAGPGGACPAPASPGIGYVIYTSGSTGQPKGVEMPHSALASLLDWQLRNSGSAVGWNTLQFAAFSFDVAFQEIFATWGSGGTLVMVEDEVRRDADRLLEFIAAERIHRLFLPFVALQQLAETATRRGQVPGDLREVATAGEQLHVSPAIRELFAVTGASLENQYGPAETHVVTAERLAADPGTWAELPAIGRPVDRCAIEILDSRQQPLPAGVPGELCISGDHLAHGYVGRRELTAERFVRRHGSLPRLYRTGDFGRILPDGRIQYLGRRDGQVKIRGFRVELGEIESRAKAQTGLADAVVVAQDLPPGGKRLIAYYLLAPGFDVAPRGLRRALSAALPEHMVPAACVALQRFPLTPSGKVDRRELAARDLPSDPVAAYQAVLDAAPGGSGGSAFGAPPSGPAALEEDGTPAKTPIGQVLAAIWAEALCMPEIGAHANLFSAGGNSLMAMELSATLSEIFSIEIPPRLLLERPTVAEQAVALETMDSTCAHSLEEIAQRLLAYS